MTDQNNTGTSAGTEKTNDGITAAAETSSTAAPEGQLLGTPTFKIPTPEKEVVKEREAQQQQQQPQQQGGQRRFERDVKVAQQLISYIESMTPGNGMTDEAGGVWQRSLFNLLRTVLANTNPEQFRKEWLTILQMVDENRDGVFHENYVMRFPFHWNLSDNEAAVFRRLVSVVLESSSPKKRQAFAKNTNLETVIQGLSEVQKNNLLSFYS